LRDVPGRDDYGADFIIGSAVVVKGVDVGRGCGDRPAEIVLCFIAADSGFGADMMHGADKASSAIAILEHAADPAVTDWAKKLRQQVEHGKRLGGVTAHHSASLCGIVITKPL
jgi:hypothetical protein